MDIVMRSPRCVCPACIGAMAAADHHMGTEAAPFISLKPQPYPPLPPNKPTEVDPLNQHGGLSVASWRDYVAAGGLYVSADGNFYEPPQDGTVSELVPVKAPTTCDCQFACKGKSNCTRAAENRVMRMRRILETPTRVFYADAESGHTIDCSHAGDATAYLMEAYTWGRGPFIFGFDPAMPVDYLACGLDVSDIYGGEVIAQYGEDITMADLGPGMPAEGRLMPAAEVGKLRYGDRLATYDIRNRPLSAEGRKALAAHAKNLHGQVEQATKGREAAAAQANKYDARIDKLNDRIATIQADLA